MTNNFFLKISKFLLCLAPFTAIIIYQGTLFPFIVSKYVFFRIVTGLALIFYLIYWAFQSKPLINADKKWRQPLIIATALFVAIFLLAGFFGYDPSASFWSNFERGEGSLQLLNLFIFFLLLFLVFRDEKSWRQIFIISVVAALLVIGYGVAGALGIENFVGSSLCQRFAGSLGNAAYTGTYLIFAMFYAAYLSNETKSKFKKWFLIGLVILFFAFLLLTQTRGALLGLVAAVFFGLWYLFFNSSNTRCRYLLLGVIIFLIILGSLGLIYRRSINLMPFCPPEAGGGNRILDISFSTQNYQTRLSLWQQSIKAFKERPLLGWGPENFTTAFEKYYDPRLYDLTLRYNPDQRLSQTWFDRAHSIYFDYLVMTGILGFLSFIGIFAVLYWQFFKKTRINADINADKRGYKQQSTVNSQQSTIQNALLFALPIAYLVQGLVLFDVLPIYINLFLFLAFMNYKFNVGFQN